MAFSLTKKQNELLEYIKDYLAEHDGIAPSFEQMKEAIGIKTKSGVHRLITALEQRGHIIKIPYCARALRIAEPMDLGGVPSKDLIAELARRRAFNREMRWAA